MDEINNLIYFAKKVDNKYLQKIRNLKDKKEKIEALKYLIKLRLEEKKRDLNEDIDKLKKEDRFFIEIKIAKLESKIKIFNATHHKKDFNNVMLLFKDIKKEIKNVRSV